MQHRVRHRRLSSRILFYFGLLVVAALCAAMFMQRSITPMLHEARQSTARVETIGAISNISLLTECDELPEAARKLPLSNFLNAHKVHMVSFPRFAYSAHAAQGGPSLDTLIKDRWEAMRGEHILRFDVPPDRPISRLQGHHQFVKVLAAGRATAKRQNKALDLEEKHVIQAFDPKGFNFRKALPAELFFVVAEESGSHPSVSCAHSTSDASVVLVNVSPVDHGSLLLIPHVGRGLPQVLTAEAISLAIAFQQAMTAPNFRLGFNGLGGFASVNHLHFQGYFFAEHGLPGAPLGGLPIEAAQLSLLSSSVSHSVSELADYPVPGLCFATPQAMSDAAWKNQFISAVMRCVDHLVKEDVPHNLLLAPSVGSRGFRIFLLPSRSFRRTDPFEIGPAFPEISGHMIVKRESEYTKMKEADVVTILRKVAISDDDFEKLKTCVE